MSIKIGKYLVEYDDQGGKLLFYDLQNGLPTKPIFSLPISQEVRKDFKKWIEKEILSKWGD